MRLVNAILGAAALAVLVWMVSRLGTDRLADAASRIGWAFPAAAAAHFASLVAASVSLRLAVGAPLGFGAALAVEMAGHAVNEATPMSRLGELTKYGMLAERVAPGRAAAGVIVWNIGLFVAATTTVAIACAVALASFEVSAAARPVLIGGAVANLAALAIAVALLYTRIGAWPFAVLGWLRVSEARRERWRAGWARVEAAWAEVAADRRRIAAIIATSFVVRAINVIEGGLILAALGVDPLVASALVGYASFQLAFWLTSWVPLQAGTAEGGAYLSFAAIGLPGGAGVILELARKLRRLLFIAAGLIVLGLGLARPSS